MIKLGCFLFMALCLVVFTINVPICGIPLILVLILFAVMKAIG